MKIVFLLPFLWLGVSCRPPHAPLSQPHEAWSGNNDPSILDPGESQQSYLFGWRQLPLQGRLSNSPLWSGDYWPSDKGGISYRWNATHLSNVSRYSYPLLNKDDLDYVNLTNLSPAEKFDIYKGRFDFPLTLRERQRTQVLSTIRGHPAYRPGFRIAYWEGLCHSWAPATIAYPSPQPLTVLSKAGIEIPFGASDVKALLTAFLHYHDDGTTAILGGRCEVDAGGRRGSNGRSRWSGSRFSRKLGRPECRDVNPGAFHIVLANQIALEDKAFLVDITRDAEVWNQAVVGYESVVEGISERVSRRAAYGTQVEVTIYTKMHYVAEVEHSWQGLPNQEAIETAHYRYILELDGGGNIIGGEWISGERPDFLWKRDVPEFRGYFKELGELLPKLEG